MPDEMSIILSNELSNIAAQTTLDLQGLVASMRTSGMSDSAIRATLMSDLTSGGRLFGNYRNGVKNTVKSGVGRAGNIASEGRFFSAGVNEFQWVAVSSKPCPDCERRHGETGTMEYWRTAGKPRSGFSVCQSNCQCQLLPVGYTGENLDKPLVKGKQLTEKDLQKKFYKNHHIGYKNKDGSIGGVNLSGNIKSDTELLNAIGSLEKDGYRVNWFGIEASGVSSKRFSPLPGNTIASSTSTPIGHKLELSASVLRNRSKMKEMLKRNVDNEWFIRGGDTIKATIDHEFAHSVTISYGQATINYQRAEFVKIRNDYFNRFDELKQKLFKAKAGTKEWDVIFDELKKTKISNYAKESLEEFVAEAFSMARNSTNPSEFALKVQSLIDEIVKQ